MRVQLGRATELLALCHDRVPRHTGQFGSRDRFLAPCRDINFVSRQGLGLGQGAWVTTRVTFCRDRVFPRLGHSCCNRRFYVAT